MKRIYLMRHGQTLFNLTGRIQGFCDSPLTDEGISMALKIGKYFIDNNIKFDYGYTSTSERAEDTLLLIDSHINYSRLKHLKEINYGPLEGSRVKELYNKYPYLSINNYDQYLEQEGVELLSDAYKRFNGAINSVFTSSHQKVIVVSHGIVIANWINHLSEEMLAKYLALKKDKSIRLKNCDCLVLEYDKSVINIVDYIYNQQL